MSIFKKKLHSTSYPQLYSRRDVQEMCSDPGHPFTNRD